MEPDSRRGYWAIKLKKNVLVGTISELHSDANRFAYEAEI